MCSQQKAPLEPSRLTPMSQPTAITVLTLARAEAELQRVTAQLIQALTAQLRDSNDSRAAQVAELEQRRDSLHQRLAQLEAAFEAQKKR